ncbi:MAG: hypothetical protein KDB86_02390 [Actinobacteria bacterium]|nr:hypothetical protein [Actinomycetota bacterium]MCB9388815.1 hypothetical protein [Acidimicrobiia bacterium]
MGIRRAFDMLTISSLVAPERAATAPALHSAVSEEDTKWFWLVGVGFSLIVAVPTSVAAQWSAEPLGALLGALCYLLISGGTPVASILGPGRLRKAAAVLAATILSVLIVANADSAVATGGVIICSYSLFSLQPSLAAPNRRTAVLGPILAPSVLIGTALFVTGLALMGWDSGVNGVLAGGMGCACGMAAYAMSVRTSDGYAPGSFFGGVGCAQFVALATLLLLNSVAA